MNPTPRAAQARLTEPSADLLRQAAEVGLALLDADGRIRWASEPLSDFLGIARPDLQGETLQRYCTPESARDLSARLAEGGLSDSIAVFCLDLRAPSRPEKRLCCALSAGGGFPRLLTGCPEEVLPQRSATGRATTAADAALRAAEVRLHAVLDNAPIAIWTWEDWKVTHFSRFWSRIAGNEQLSPGESTHWADALVPEDRERAVREFRDAVRAGRPYEGEGRIQRRDGTILHVWTKAIPVHHLESGQLFYQGYTVDVTRRNELEDRLRQAQKMEAVGQLAGGIAQEYSNLLTAITGYIQLMQAEVGPGHPLHGHLDQLNSAADQAGTLTRQLMAVSSKQLLDRRALDLNLAITDLRVLIHRVLEANTRFVAELDPDLSPVYADRNQIEQVLLNLWLNARDSMSQGGSLTVRTRNVELDEQYCSTHPDVRPGRYVELMVADTGAGMAAEERERLFEPFFSGTGRGGLGLAMVYGIVRQHEGAIEVNSTPGTGTVVQLWLPAIDEQQLVDARPESPVMAHGGMETVLVGEDDPLMRGFIESALHSMGYQVLMAGSAEEALELFQTNHDQIDLALLDVVMPRKGGREVAREMRARRPNVRILFMSGYGVPPDSTGESWLDGEELLTKPFAMTSLGRKVREVLDRGPSGSF